MACRILTHAMGADQAKKNDESFTHGDIQLK